MEERSYFITGIDTDVGKTVVAAVLVEKLKCNYWKPVQSGDLHHTDTDKVKAMVSNTQTKYYPETIRLNEPLSPHASAKIDGVHISLDDFSLPATSNLIVEGAGGLFVPLNHEGDCIIDLAVRLDLETIVVVRNYLGSINHTLLTLSELKNRGIKVKGMILVGEENKESQEIITTISGVSYLGIVPIVEKLDEAFIRECGKEIVFSEK